MESSRRRLLMIVAGVLVSVLLLFYLFKDIEFVRLWEVLRSANYLWLIPNIVLIIIAMYLRAFRWQTMLMPLKRVKFSKLVAATCIGFMANNVLPLRLGELVRAYSLSAQDKEISKSSALANIFVERMVFELMALLLIFGLVLGFFGMPWDDRFELGLTIALSAALVGLIFILVMALKPKLASHIVHKWLSFIPERIVERIDDIILKFSQGLEFLTDARMVLLVSVQTLSIWAILGVSNYFVFLAFGLNRSLSASFVLLVVVSVAIMMPSSPGYVGVYHWATVWTMTAYDVNPEDALSFALVLHAAQYLTVTLMGLYFLKKKHLTLKRLEDEAEELIA